MSDQPTFDGMPVKLFSCTPSRLDTWLDCPRKYRYTYIDTPRPPRGGPWAHASMGAAVHNALREWWTKPLEERTSQVGEVLLTKFWRTDGFKDDEQAERGHVGQNRQQRAIESRARPFRLPHGTRVSGQGDASRKAMLRQGYPRKPREDVPSARQRDQACKLGAWCYKWGNFRVACMGEI